eukprot:Sdes_comp18507_c0_seq2m8544
MANRHGAIYLIKEIHLQAHKLKSTLVRVLGRVKEISLQNSFVIISHEDWELKIDTCLLGPVSFKIGSLFQFIGELEVTDTFRTPRKHQIEGLLLKATVTRCVDGLDVGVYTAALDIKRRYLNQDIEVD